MWKFFATAAALLLTAPGQVLAQAAAPASAASAAKAESTEAQAAMERAQRLAANPMRVILQASKFKRKAAEPDPTPEVVDPASLRRTAVRTGPADTAPAPVQANAAKPAPPPAAAPAPVPAPVVVAAAPAPEPPQPKMMPASLLAGAAKSSVPAMDIELPAEAAPEMAKAVAPQSLPMAQAVVRPSLLSMVEPDIPARVMNESGRVREVLADLSLREDGSVAQVTLVPPVPRAWQRYLLAALEKWRFEPLPSARVHRVQLVFDDK